MTRQREPKGRGRLSGGGSRPGMASWGDHAKFEGRDEDTLGKRRGAAWLSGWLWNRLKWECGTRRDE